MTDKTKKIIAREELIPLIVFLLVFPITIKFGRIIFVRFLPAVSYSQPANYRTLGTLVGTVYFIAVYWIIYLLCRFIIWVVRTLKKP